MCSKLTIKKVEQSEVVLRRYSTRNDLLKIITKHLCRSVFFMKLQSLALRLYFKEALTQMVPCEFWKIFRNISGRLLVINIFMRQFHEMLYFIKPERCQFMCSKFTLFKVHNKDPRMLLCRLYVNFERT